MLIETIRIVFWLRQYDKEHRENSQTNHIETKKPFKMFSCDEFVDRETIIK